MPPGSGFPHFRRWVVFNWWPWISVPAAVTIGIILMADGGWSALAVLPVPVSIAIGYRRHFRKAPFHSS